MKDLLARLRALLRRSAGQAAPVLKSGALLLDTFLCRCGHSANKPFCDNTQKKFGFVA
jgi:CDGSH-type Zn-finger protein